MKYLIAALAACVALSGCMSPKSFVDPTFPKVTYEEIKRSPSPPKVVLTTQFQRHGEHFPKADSTLRDSAERVLRASGAVFPSSDGNQGQIHIVVNNIGEDGAAAKGFGAGLTFGIVGTTVMDAYELSITMKVGQRTFSRQAVRHAIHTTIGNASTPPGVETVPINVAFDRVLEQLLLRVLKEYQITSDSASL